MLARSCSRAAPRARLMFKRADVSACARSQCRRYAMPASAPAPATMNTVGSIAPMVRELDRMAPSFDIQGSQIRIIQTPTEFYETLKVRSTHTPGCGSDRRHKVRLTRVITSRIASSMPSAAFFCLRYTLASRSASLSRRCVTP
jgi:hypothetical protein